jgi:adenylate cyclase
VATEIERKFLVNCEAWRAQAAPGIRFRQGYLAGGGKASVRVRVEGETANINIKSATLGVRRQEYEYPIPLADAHTMLESLCDGRLVEKTRYCVTVGEHVWEVDVFEGENAGLVVAEIELDHEDEAFIKPDWAGEEVSRDPRYYNVYLAQHPYKEW